MENNQINDLIKETFQETGKRIWKDAFKDAFKIVKYYVQNSSEFELKQFEVFEKKCEMVFENNLIDNYCLSRMIMIEMIPSYFVEDDSCWISTIEDAKKYLNEKNREFVGIEDEEKIIEFTNELFFESMNEIVGMIKFKVWELLIKVALPQIEIKK